MFNKLALTGGLLSLLIGIALLSQEISKSDPAQTANLIGGALLVALGLVSIPLVVREWWEWRKNCKEARGPSSD